MKPEVKNRVPNFTIPGTEAANLGVTNALDRVANVQGVERGQVDLQGFRELLSALATGNLESVKATEFYKNYIGEISGLLQQLAQDGETITGEDALKLSFGKSIPSFRPEMQRVKVQTGREDPEILLVGAFTIQTAEQFVATARSVFSSPNLHIVDPGNTRAKEMQGEINFRNEDFLKGPYPPNSMDIIMADFLFDHLADSGGESYFLALKSMEDVISQFLAVAAKTLKPGGRLVLTEHTFSRNEQMLLQKLAEDLGIPSQFAEVIMAERGREYRGMIEELLKHHGFVGVGIEPHLLIRDRKVLDGPVMVGNDWNLDLDDIGVSRSGILITATKSI